MRGGPQEASRSQQSGTCASILLPLWSSPLTHALSSLSSKQSNFWNACTWRRTQPCLFWRWACCRCPMGSCFFFGRILHGLVHLVQLLLLPNVFAIILLLRLFFLKFLCWWLTFLLHLLWLTGCVLLSTLGLVLAFGCHLGVGGCRKPNPLALLAGATHVRHRCVCECIIALTTKMHANLHIMCNQISDSGTMFYAHLLGWLLLSSTVKRLLPRTFPST